MLPFWRESGPPFLRGHCCWIACISEGGQVTPVPADRRYAPGIMLTLRAVARGNNKRLYKLYLVRNACLRTHARTFLVFARGRCKYSDAVYTYFKACKYGRLKGVDKSLFCEIEFPIPGTLMWDLFRDSFPFRVRRDASFLLPRVHERSNK